jgi:hypothetical protein
LIWSERKKETASVFSLSSEERKGLVGGGVDRLALCCMAVCIVAWERLAGEFVAATGGCCDVQGEGWVSVSINGFLASTKKAARLGSFSFYLILELSSVFLSHSNQGLPNRKSALNNNENQNKGEAKNSDQVR